VRKCSTQRRDENVSKTADGKREGKRPLKGSTIILKFILKK